MMRSVVRIAIFAFPRRWRRKYAVELQDLTVLVLCRTPRRRKRLGILLDVVVRGLDERVRRTESLGPKTALTSTSALIAGMFVLASAVASDSVLAPNVRLAASAHLGAGVSLHDATKHGTTFSDKPGQIDVVVNARQGSQVSVQGFRSEVVINTKSGQVVSVTRAAGPR